MNSDDNISQLAKQKRSVTCNLCKQQGHMAKTCKHNPTNTKNLAISGATQSSGSFKFQAYFE